MIHLDDQHAKRRIRVLQQTSASQITEASRCERRWFFAYVEGLRQPSTAAQLRGISIDNEYVQPYLRDGSIKQGEWTPLLKILIPHLPSPQQRPEVQKQINLPTYDGGPNLLGFIDLIYPQGNWLQIDDLKTTSDFRYCKSEDQLRNDVQMMTYAKWAHTQVGDKIAIAHIYARTTEAARAHRSTQPHGYVDGKMCKCKNCTAWRHAANCGKQVDSLPIFVSLTEVNQIWDRSLATVRRMMIAAKEALRGEELTPNTEACMDYGGCPHRGRCGLMTVTSLKKGVIMSTEKANGLMARLRAAKESNGAQKPTEEIVDQLASQVDEARKQIDTGKLKPDGNGQVFDRRGADSGWILRAPTEAEKIAFGETLQRGQHLILDAVLPPDAPSRTSTPEEVAAASEPKKRGRPKKEKKHIRMKIDGVLFDCTLDDDGNITSQEKVEFTIQAPSVEQPIQPAVEVKAKPDAELTKVLHEKRPQDRKVPAKAPMLFIDALVVKGVPGLTPFEEWFGPIAELAAVAHEVSDVRLISYTAKGILATAVRECLDTCPPALLIDSRQFGADEALAALIPHASLVVRGIR